MRTSRLVASVVLGLALGAPAAHATSPASICDPVGTGSFFSDSVTASGAAAGRGAVREPDLGQVHEDLPASAKGTRRQAVQGDSPGLLPRRDRREHRRADRRQIDAQIDVLNSTFAGGEGGAATGLPLHSSPG